MNIVFAGTPEFAAIHLAALLLDGRHTVLAVYTQPDRRAGRGKHMQASPVKILAESHGLPVYQPRSLRDAEAQRQLAALQPEVMVVVAYGLLLPQAVLDIPRRGCINVHASLLPRWRGAAPVQRAVEAGDAETGITLMQMDAGLDTGPMLSKTRCPIAADETGGSLHDKLAALGSAELPMALVRLASGELPPQVQDETQACYAAKLDKTEARLDWRQDARELERRIRAFNPFPVAYTELEGQRIRVWSAVVLGTGNAAGCEPGQIFSADVTGIAVRCGSGSLLLTEIQLPGKKRLAVGEVLNSRAELFQVGRVFEY